MKTLILSLATLGVGFFALSARAQNTPNMELDGHWIAVDRICTGATSQDFPLDPYVQGRDSEQLDVSGQLIFVTTTIAQKTTVEVLIANLQKQVLFNGQSNDAIGNYSFKGKGVVTFFTKDYKTGANCNGRELQTTFVSVEGCLSVNESATLDELKTKLEQAKKDKPGCEHMRGAAACLKPYDQAMIDYLVSKQFKDARACAQKGN